MLPGYAGSEVGVEVWKCVLSEGAGEFWMSGGTAAHGGVEVMGDRGVVDAL